MLYAPLRVATIDLYLVSVCSFVITRSSSSSNSTHLSPFTFVRLSHLTRGLCLYRQLPCSVHDLHPNKPHCPPRPNCAGNQTDTNLFDSHLELCPRPPRQPRSKISRVAMCVEREEATVVHVRPDLAHPMVDLDPTKVRVRISVQSLPHTSSIK